MSRLYHATAVASFLALAGRAAAGSVSVTPHDSYSSSVGVLGCKIDTNRVAYWPGSVDCSDICVKLTYGSRSVNLLRIDESGGAYDISYDAWVYLQTGNSATTDPLAGGGVEMEYENVDASECAGLIHTSNSKLPLSAANSMNFVSSCISDPSSWVGQNYVLYNILDAICSLGYDEECTLDLDISNQPSCPHTLGLTASLTTAPVYNIEYETGTAVNAATGDTVSASVALAADSTDDDSTTDSSSDSTDTGTSTSTSTTAATSAAVVAGTTSSTSAVTPTAATVSSAAVTVSSSTYSAPETTVAAVATTSTVGTATTAKTTAAVQLLSNSPGVFVVTSETVKTLSATTTYSSSSSSSSFSTTVATTAATIAASISTASTSAKPSHTLSSGATVGTVTSSGRTTRTTFSVATASAFKAVSDSASAAATTATSASGSTTAAITASASNGATVHLWAAMCASLILVLLG